MRRHRRTITAALLLVGSAAGAAAAAAQVRPAPVPPAVAPVAPAPGATFDHGAFDALLRAHVRDGLVDYDAFAAAPTFRAYLAQLAGANVAVLGPQERLAFWLNSYNAYTIALIVKHGERESIRNIDRTLGFLRLKGPWNERMVEAGGQSLTLDEVEHRILRREFREPRIHFAIVPAARGAPPLRSEAYSGAQLDAQLEDQTRRFLGDTTRNPINSRGGLQASAILTAYQSDFAPSRQELAAWAAPYFEGRVRARLDSGMIFQDPRPFDWRLNAVAKGATAGPQKSAR